MIKLGWGLLLAVCYVFIAAGAVNAGFTRVFWAIPFMVGAVYIADNHLRIKRLSYLTFAFSLAAVAVNLTLSKNPWVFPILADGEVEVVSEVYANGTKIFLETPGSCEDLQPEVECPGYMKLRVGEKHRVIGIELSHPEFASNVDLVTEFGTVLQGSYGNSIGFDYPPSMQVVKPNKDIHAIWAVKLSILMAWPISFFIEPFDKFAIAIVIIIAAIYGLRDHVMMPGRIKRPPKN